VAERISQMEGRDEKNEVVIYPYFGCGGGHVLVRRYWDSIANK